MKLKEKELHNFREQLEKERRKHDAQLEEIEVLKEKIEQLVLKKL